MSIISRIKEVFNIGSTLYTWLSTGYDAASAQLKETGTFLQSYTDDIEEEAKGETLDPDNPTGKHYLNQYKIFNYLSPQTQQRARKFADFICSPTVTRLIGLATVGLLFLSPLGPVAAGVAVAFTLTATVAGFAVQSYKIMKLERLKTIFKQLESLKDTNQVLKEQIAEHPHKKILEGLYEENILVPSRLAQEAVVHKDMKTTASQKYSLVGVLESSTILISGILSFNIPAVMIAGITFMTSNVSRGGREKGAAENYKFMAEHINNNAKELELGFKVSAKNETLANLHKAQLRQRAFADALSHPYSPNLSAIDYKQEFNKVFNNRLHEYERYNRPPSMTFTDAMKSNFITGFSTHKGLQQQVALSKDLTRPKFNIAEPPAIPIKVAEQEQTHSKIHTRESHHHRNTVLQQRNKEERNESQEKGGERSI